MSAYYRSRKLKKNVEKGVLVSVHITDLYTLIIALHYIYSIIKISNTSILLNWILD